MYLSPGDPLLFLVCVYLDSGAGSFQQGVLYFLACGDLMHGLEDEEPVLLQVSLFLL
uniref:Uncharacterized protein n=1 Tax=Lepeophtheirus salmonis TaxID=72036 RepID=A0A0K2TR15_LEPSM